MLNLRRIPVNPARWLYEWLNYLKKKTYFYSMWTMWLFKYLNLQISSKKSSAVSWQFFIWEILITIFLSFTLKSTSDSRVLSFCSAFKGDLTVTRTSSKLGITKFECNCNATKKKYFLSYIMYRNYFQSIKVLAW